MKFNVITICWGDKYSPDYVTRLENMVRRHTTHEPTFYHMNTIDKGLPGWWQKLALFKPDLVPDLPTLFLDLDTVIIDNIDAIIEYPGDYVCPRVVEGLSKPCSALIKWTPKRCEFIWKVFRSNLPKLNEVLKARQLPTLTSSDPSPYTKYEQYWSPAATHYVTGGYVFGDMDVLEGILLRHGGMKTKDQIELNNMKVEFLPDEWTWSYKWGPRGMKKVQLSEPPAGAKICMFHGKPDPHEVGDAWVKENWI